MSSGFVTEKEIDEQKKARQEEWERVRKPEDPEIAPEVPYDPRSLFEQLEEHRIKKQDEWDESHKLKNQIRGLGNYYLPIYKPFLICTLLDMKVYLSFNIFR